MSFRPGSPFPTSASRLDGYTRDAGGATTSVGDGEEQFSRCNGKTQSSTSEQSAPLPENIQLPKGKFI